MNVCIKRQRRTTAVTAICTLMLCAAVIIFSKACADGAANGIEMCLGILVPSLFPFMALSSFIVKSGLSQILGRPFRPIMSSLFGLNECFAPILILSLIGGYPIGAKGVAELYKSGQADLHQSKKAALAVVCAGPGFIVNFIGSALYNNNTIGYIILASQIISVLVLAVVINLFDKSKRRHNSYSEIAASKMAISEAVTEAAYESAKGIINICIFVVLFSAFTNIISCTVGNQSVNTVAVTLLEVCSATKALSGKFPVELVAFAVGYGGLCVHFQIFSALGGIKINKALFFLIRIIQGAVTALLTHIGMMIFPETKAVFSTGTINNTSISNGSIVSSAVLLVVAICFLFTLKNFRYRYN